MVRRVSLVECEFARHARGTRSGDTEPHRDEVRSGFREGKEKESTKAYEGKKGKKEIKRKKVRGCRLYRGARLGSMRPSLYECIEFRVNAGKEGGKEKRPRTDLVIASFRRRGKRAEGQGRDRGKGRNSVSSDLREGRGGIGEVARVDITTQKPH